MARARRPGWVASYVRPLVRLRAEIRAADEVADLPSTSPWHDAPQVGEECVDVYLTRDGQVRTVVVTRDAYDALAAKGATPPSESDPTRWELRPRAARLVTARTGLR